MLISGRALVALTEGAGRCAGLGDTVGGIWSGGLPRKGTTVEGTGDPRATVLLMLGSIPDPGCFPTSTSPHAFSREKSWIYA